MSFISKNYSDGASVSGAIFCILLSITIFSLDIAYQLQTLNKASIARNEINSTINYTGINTALYVLAIFYFGCLFWLILQNITEKPFELFLSTLALILLQIPREAICVKFMLCFNYSNNAIIIARCILTFLYSITLLALHTKFLLTKKNVSKYEVGLSPTLVRLIGPGKVICFILSVLALIAIVAMNIVVLVNLNPSLKTKFRQTK